MNTRLRWQSSSTYLAFLNIVDTFFLFCVLTMWLGWLNVHLMDRAGWCQVIIYLSYTCAFLSAWTVTTFTAERWVVVFHPLQKHRLCTPRRARHIILGLVISALVLYSFSTWTSGVETADGVQLCMPYPKYFTLLRVLTSIDAFLVLVLPSVIIIILNVGITAKICEFVYRRKVNSVCLNHINGKQVVVTCPKRKHRKAEGQRNSEWSLDSVGKLKVPRELTCNRNSASCSNSSNKDTDHSRSQNSYNCPEGPERGIRKAHHSSCPCFQKGYGENQNQSEFRHATRSPVHGRSPNGSPSMCRRSKLRSSQSSATFQKKVTLSAHLGHAPHACALHSYQIRITRSLVLVSTIFVVLNLPSYVLRLYVTIVYLRNDIYVFPKSTLLWQQVLQILYYCNYSVNVFLYCACSRSFRCALKRLIRNWKDNLLDHIGDVTQPMLKCGSICSASEKDTV